MYPVKSAVNNRFCKYLLPGWLSLACISAKLIPPLFSLNPWSSPKEATVSGYKTWGKIKAIFLFFVELDWAVWHIMGYKAVLGWFILKLNWLQSIFSSISSGQRMKFFLSTLSTEAKTLSFTSRFFLLKFLSFSLSIAFFFLGSFLDLVEKNADYSLHLTQIVYLYHCLSFW